MVMEFVLSKIHDMIDVEDYKMKLEDLIDTNLDMIKEMILGMATVEAATEFVVSQLGMTEDEIMEMATMDTAMAYIM